MFSLDPDLKLFHSEFVFFSLMVSGEKLYCQKDILSRIWEKNSSPDPGGKKATHQGSGILECGDTIKHKNS
jgi:hypothetical protein